MFYECILDVLNRDVISVRPSQIRHEAGLGDGYSCRCRTSF